MMHYRTETGRKSALLAATLGCCILVPPASAQSATPASGTPVPAASAPSPYQRKHVSKREELHYGVMWGVDSLVVKLAESGEIIRFTYRVLDEDKAKVLNDKKSDPYLLALNAQVKLVVPSLEKIGQLRQSSTPVAGKAYWMAFSNKGRLVKRGDSVSVVIGQFRADNLIVE